MNSKTKIETYTLSKLQMYDECPQKYKLCYIDRVHVIENANSAQVGTKIHNLINYYYKGQDVLKMVEALPAGEKLLWHNFKNNSIQSCNYITGEYAFNFKLDEYWLTGRIDALFESAEHYIIADWKTGENFTPENGKFQTTFYLYCMYEILKMRGMIKKPEQLSLNYIDLASDSTIRIPFDGDLYIQYKNKILDIIHKITEHENYFCNKTDNCKHCKYYAACAYY